MPKFKSGDPQVSFKKKDGTSFIQTYHSRHAAAISVVAWRKKGGKVNGTGQFRRNMTRQRTGSGLTPRRMKY